MASDYLTAPPSGKNGNRLNYLPSGPTQPRPRGRPAAGLSVREWINIFVAKDLSQAKLERIARRQARGAAKRLAAQQLCRALHYADLADFERYLSGGATLAELRREGVDTAAIKRLRVSRSDDGQRTRDLELIDAGREFDRIVNHTDGFPVKRVEQQTTVTQRYTLDEIVRRLHAAGIPREMWSLMAQERAKTLIDGQAPSQAKQIESSIVEPEIPPT